MFQYIQVYEWKIRVNVGGRHTLVCILKSKKEKFVAKLRVVHAGAKSVH
jgi:hypothetical protein